MIVCLFMLAYAQHTFGTVGCVIFNNILHFLQCNQCLTTDSIVYLVLVFSNTLIWYIMQTLTHPRSHNMQYIIKALLNQIDDLPILRKKESLAYRIVKNW